MDHGRIVQAAAGSNWNYRIAGWASFIVDRELSELKPLVAE
jgi:hypothetical protein